MKFFIAFAALVAIALAAPPASSDDASAQVLKELNENHADGSYSHSHELSNGISASESGSLRQVPGAETPVIVSQGSYSYTGPDGQPINLDWVADENGFQPKGAHLPVAPVV